MSKLRILRDAEEEGELAEQLVTTDEDEDGETEAIKDLPRDEASMDDMFSFDIDEDDIPGNEESEKQSIEYSDEDWIHVKLAPEDGFSDEFEIETESDDLIDIRELKNLTRDQASKFAEYVIQVLEEDLAEYVQRTGNAFPEPGSAESQEMKSDISSCSLKSVWSDLLPGDPSLVRMVYERGVSAYCDTSLRALAPGRVDKQFQVAIHRACKPRTRKSHRYSQTLEMTFLTEEAALFVFKQMYPQADDYKPADPPSRKASEELAIKLGEKADQDVDTKQRPSVVSLSSAKQLLQPLVTDYYKEEKFVTGCRFTGEFKSRQFFKGRYDHPTGAQMESEFIDGHFESRNHFGIVSYPRGDVFEGEWRKGRFQSGQITFADGLKFITKDWKYCEPPDRRFRIERYFGMKPAGATLFSDQYPPPSVPPGTYETGDGYFNPTTGEIRGYDGLLVRKVPPTSPENFWIERNCRKVHSSFEHCAPRFLTERIPGSYVELRKGIPLTRKTYH